MSPGGAESLTDALTLIGLLTVPAYFLYWFLYHRSRRLTRRPWIGPAALLLWIVATYVCLVSPMIGCLGGHCGGRVSPFLELAIGYAATSVTLIVWLHRVRAA
jgi:hypothetical protein